MCILLREWLEEDEEEKGSETSFNGVFSGLMKQKATSSKARKKKEGWKWLVKSKQELVNSMLDVHQELEANLLPRNA